MLKSLYKIFWVPVMGRLLSRLIPLLEGKPPRDLPTYDIDGEKKIKKTTNYSGNEPPWQYPTAREFKSIAVSVLLIFLDLRYLVVFSMHEELEDV